MVILTGGAGFVGGNILARLNQLGEDDILVVDNLKNSQKYLNLVGARFRDYIDKDDFLHRLESGEFQGVRGILHQGACTDTMEYDGRYMLRNNFDYSKRLLSFALDKRIPMIYASSAAVYGQSGVCRESDGQESPLNVYGYSKYLFDDYVRRVVGGASSTIVGLRYFNVYGPGEAHKGKMSSMVYQLFHQVRNTGVAKLFGAFGGHAAGEQTRDFVYVKDIVEMNMFFWQGPPRQTIVNAGSGMSRTWNDLGRAVIAALGKGKIEYIDFPPQLADKYQFSTGADLAHLRSFGFSAALRTLEEGVREYVAALESAEERRVRA